MTTLQMDTNYTSGSYSTDLMNFLMPEENNPLFLHKTPLTPQWDGGRSIAIGYGLDLLKGTSINPVKFHLPSSSFIF